MSEFHAVVWLDHQEARIFHFNAVGFGKAEIQASPKHRKIHHKAGQTGSGKQASESTYFQQVAKALQGAREVLVLGPADAKEQFVKYVHHHHSPIAKAILGVETTDHPSDGQILQLARDYFKAKDRLLPQV